MKKFIVLVMFLSVSVFSCKSVDPGSDTLAFTAGSCPVKYVKEAATEISSEEVSAVSELLNAVCNNSNITTKLFSDDYGWEGSSNNFGSYLNKYQETTQGTILYTKTGIAMKFPKVTGIDYAEILFKAYTDANWRRQYYTLPSNIQLSNVKIISDLAANNNDSFSIKYTSSITNSVKVLRQSITRATVYDTTLNFTKITDKLYVFTERSLEKGAMTRKSISFLIRDYSDHDKIIQLEERAVNYSTSFFEKQVLPQVKTIMFNVDKNLSTALYNAIKKFQ